MKFRIRVQSLIWEDILEKEMATHSKLLAWEVAQTEEHTHTHACCAALSHSVLDFGTPWTAAR